ncbi:MAG: C4-type zinc ribbon domain-containing protein [Lentisphaeria bacterium]
MRTTVNELLRLQELELILAESRIIHASASHPPTAIRQIEADIASLRAGIPMAHLRRYDRLRRSGLGVAQEEGGVCTACHLSVNQGDLIRMRRGEMAWTCPHCARFLLLTPANADSP